MLSPSGTVSPIHTVRSCSCVTYLRHLCHLFSHIAFVLKVPVVHIDPTYPGDQGEGIFVSRMSDTEHGGTEWKGCIEIEMLVDERDVREDLYSIEYMEGSNEATLTKPSFPAASITWCESITLSTYITKSMCR